MHSQVEAFIQERVYLKSVTPATVRWYRCAFKAFEGALDSLETIKGRIVELRQRGLTAVSVNVHLRCIKAFYRWQEKPWSIPRLKEDQKVLATLTPQHVRAIISYRPKGINSTRAWMVSLVILDAGLRISEVLQLRKQDLDFDNLILRVQGKGNKERLVPMSIELRKSLWRYVRDRHDRVFTTRTGTTVTTRNFQRDMKVLCKKLGIAGVRTSPHTLRHTFACGYLRNGGNVFYLSKILGHTSVKTTERYLQSLGIEDLSAVHNRLSLLAR